MREVDGHPVGVDPAVDHWLREACVLIRSPVESELRGGRLVVILTSCSCLLAINFLVVEPVPVLGLTVRGSKLVLFFLASITTPSSKDPSSSPKPASDDLLMPVTVARSSAAAGPARRSAVATASFSSSRIIFVLRGTLDWEMPPVFRLRGGPPKRKVTPCVPVGVVVGVWSWAPAARGPRLSSRAQDSTQAAGTMGLGGLELGGRQGDTFSPSSSLHQPAGSGRLNQGGGGALRGRGARHTPPP